ncbi:uncharacterized protein EI90DRAFT_3014309 [Cantharellus anzutake]|uniref:uncharacterized protein n=1 Tax=Cantharellus anzutake TaxID=1750568 RepID=UPI0019084122|nr:uncharacterized protein EI90DRAFT_3014309 [Cantharellus anzutake]KAF8336627.1 hypothetical protein EI90DRAFT_3014309 [Cantharellus anzutake]
MSLKQRVIGHLAAGGDVAISVLTAINAAIRAPLQFSTGATPLILSEINCIQIEIDRLRGKMERQSGTHSPPPHMKNPSKIDDLRKDFSMALASFKVFVFDPHWSCCCSDLIIVTHCGK